VVSDHTPLIVDTGALKIPHAKQFRFEKWWLKIEGFQQVVAKFWQAPVISKIPLIGGNLK
jgi:hypothetical protein